MSPSLFQGFILKTEINWCARKEAISALDRYKTIDRPHQSNTHTHTLIHQCRADVKANGKKTGCETVFQSVSDGCQI